MIVKEGMVLVPPERGTIIGRAAWKPRYMVLGTGGMRKTQTALLEDSSRAAAARKCLKSTPSKPNLADEAADGEGKMLYVSIYKAKGDWEYIVQYPIAAFKSCEVKDVQHKKQSSSLPTLMLEMKPDITSEKQRKRRSSRAGALSSKDPWTNTLLFRTIPDDRYTVYDWQAILGSLIVPDELEEGSAGPGSPSLVDLINPSAVRERVKASDRRQDYSRGTLSSCSNGQSTQSTKMISPSPSLISRRSDLSSQASSQHPQMNFAYQNNTATVSADLPSPASTAYEPQFIEGWTSAQGRSSALSSHTRGSNSLTSVIPSLAPSSSSPPGPRETILDRAFQLKCIPGSERLSERDDPKLSSIARFEALMRHIDERKEARAIAHHTEHEVSSWDLDEDSAEDDDDEDDDDNDDDDDDGPDMSDQEVSIPTPAQRALDFISGRTTPGPTTRPLSPAPRSPPIPFLNNEAGFAFHGPQNSLLGDPRPRTGTTSARTRSSRPASLALPSRSISTSTLPTLRGGVSNNNLKISGLAEKQEDFNTKANTEKRRSSASVQRLSFQDFAKRFSSTSSLLLVQTNNSSNSGRDVSRRCSSEYGVDEDRESRNTLRVTGSMILTGPNAADRDNRDKRCGWRGSVGVFGTEGGFM